VAADTMLLVPATRQGNEPPIEDEGDRFAVVDGHSEAELTYMVRGDRLLLLHTGVPAELGGRGIGGRLVRAALERAERDGLTVVPWCSFARGWLADHPDVAAEASIDWTTTDRR
jgi:predicted GNAT family acetyltransferase